MKTKALAPLVFAASMLFVQNAQAGWIMDWIACSEGCGWICNCNGGDELPINSTNAKEKKAAQEVAKIVASFQENMRSLSPEAKTLLKKLDKGK